MHRKNAAARSFVGRCGIDGVNMSETNLPEDFLKRLKSVTAKRAKTVIDLILKQGQVTTEDLARAGYEHAPRAVRDVRDLVFLLLPIGRKIVTEKALRYIHLEIRTFA